MRGTSVDDPVSVLWTDHTHSLRVRRFQGDGFRFGWWTASWSRQRKCVSDVGGIDGTATYVS
jgi:hypothetical protein